MPRSAVMVVDNKVIGVSSFSKVRDTDLTDACGEVISIYLLPEYWSIGLGSRLLGWVLQDLKGMGFARCVVWTLEENVRAQQVYERFGFSRDQALKKLHIGGATVRGIRYIRDL